MSQSSLIENAQLKLKVPFLIKILHHITSQLKKGTNTMS